MTLAEMNDEFGAAKTNKKEFLEKLERIIPWIEFIELIEPHYYKGEHGNKPYPLELILIFNQHIDKIQSLPVMLLMVSLDNEQIVSQSLSTTF